MNAIDGLWVRPVHLVMVKEMRMEAAADLPRWCPRVETVWGEIRVPPEGAERIDND